MSIYMSRNLGSALMINGRSYRFVQNSTQPVSVSTGATSYQWLTAMSYNRADPQGKTEYSVEEQALAKYEYGTRGGYITVNNVKYYSLFKLATRDPTPSDDVTSDWLAGGRWVNRTNGKIFRCLSASTGAANWLWENQGGTLYPFDTGVIRVWGYDKTSHSLNGVGWFYSSDAGGGTNEQDSFAGNLSDDDVVGAKSATSVSSKNWWANFLPQNLP